MAGDERRISFRPMSEADLEVVMINEMRAYAFPWTRALFHDCIGAGHECRLLCVDGEVIGHAVLTAAAGEAHLLNVCVRREQQGQGLGRLFVRYLIKRAQTLGAEHLYLEVRPSNHVATALYDSLGFVQIGVRKDYYPGDPEREDALVMVLALEDL